ncbi:hypothetical protein BDZ89DRAFT_1136075 [Hymenopellis radicata]|nr:hypothetical protein BDZ89DRAFT_1136075 [Hymenopellis radicata]
MFVRVFLHNWSQFSRKFCLAGEATLAAFIQAASTEECFHVDAIDVRAGLHRRLFRWGNFAWPARPPIAALLRGSEHSAFLYARTAVCVVRPEKCEKCVAPPNRTCFSFLLSLSSNLYQSEAFALLRFGYHLSLICTSRLVRDYSRDDELTAPEQLRNRCLAGEAVGCAGCDSDFRYLQIQGVASPWITLW